LVQLASEPQQLSAATRLAFRAAFGELFLTGAGAATVALVLFLMIEQRPLRSSFEAPSAGAE